jgi:hypothetical protein
LFSNTTTRTWSGGPAAAGGPVTADGLVAGDGLVVTGWEDAAVDGLADGASAHRGDDEQPTTARQAAVSQAAVQTVRDLIAG